MSEIIETPGTLKKGEIHPSAFIAKRFIIQYMHKHSTHALIESLASNAIEGNRMAEIAGETLHRFLNAEPVSDRYLMGLAWMLFEMENNK